ncbi:MAG TPA: hypothetical protein VKT49_17950 [Bryobacteraceae bacterium]|nr:hypothetical protein [Bryobacteraceae bacterium]
MTPTERDALRSQLRAALAGREESLGVWAGEKFAKPTGVGQLRRRGPSRPPDPTRILTLVENDDGVLLWQQGSVIPPAEAAVPGLRRRSFRAASPESEGEYVDHLVIEPLEPSRANQALLELDNWINPLRGMYEWKNGTLSSAPVAPVKSGKILLVVHGTFSKGEAIFQQLNAPTNAAGRNLLGKAGNMKSGYDQILSFEHPTVSVTPMLNAVDLARAFAGSDAVIDVIAHSRGGLVTRWWLESLDRSDQLRRAILVGSPLGGTSLASPPHLRHLLSWFSNFNRFLATGSALASNMIPFLHVITALAQFTAFVTSLAAKTPLVDAAVAMIPGLASMSRISNNFELDRLRAVQDARIEYYAIKSQFQPEDPGWKVWRYFVDSPPERAVSALFPNENDWVVNTVSMTERLQLPSARVKDFGARSDIHHTSYFLQGDTASQIGQWLGIA